MKTHPITISVSLIAIVFATLFIFSPGLTGPFVLDDNLHLPKLAGYDGRVDTPSELYQFVFSGLSATGRPLSFLSLLIDSDDWPTSPYRFKRTNVLIHALNGILVFIFARLLAKIIIRDRNRAYQVSPEWVGLLAMSLWIIAPIHLSPTMMVIQRMTLLSGTLTLTALIIYLRARRIAAERPIAGYFWMSFALGPVVLIGILFKEPAILTAGFIIAMEATVLTQTSPPRPAGWYKWAFIFLAVPLLAVLVYFFAIGTRIDELFLKREFDIWERLLTESRVLLQYLRVVLLPSLVASGPFHDDYQVSRGLLDPPTTLAAISTIVGLLIFAVWARRRYPLVALPILWFFVGHLLESTVLPLELYFEHRNYIPILGIAFSAAFLVLSLRGRVGVLVRAGYLGVLLLSAFVTFQSAKVWGDRALIAAVWASEHPTSVRAQLGAAEYWAASGNINQLLNHIDRVARENPQQAGIRLFHFILDRCRAESTPSLNANEEDLKLLIPRAEFDHGSVESLDWLVNKKKRSDCNLSDAEILELIDLYLSNPRFARNSATRKTLQRMRATLFMRQGNLPETINALDLAYEAAPVFDIPLNQAWLLASGGRFDAADDYLEKARRTPPEKWAEWLWREDLTKETEESIHHLKMIWDDSEAETTSDEHTRSEATDESTDEDQRRM